MTISGWGNFPKENGTVNQPVTVSDLCCRLSNFNSVIPRGLGRSYGDSALAADMLSSLSLDCFIEFDRDNGILTCQSGVSLQDILKLAIPHGWFLHVTPGTKFVSVGGAIASDVHGKNHHAYGCFSQSLLSLKVLTPAHGIVTCSQEHNAPLFYATCGGMGLTGVIVEATIQLKAIKSSYIQETTIKAGNLEEALDLFEANADYSYSVAWIDCLSSGKSLGRSLLMLGEHEEQGELDYTEKKALPVPINMPAFMLNSATVTAFNHLYYARVRKKESQSNTHFNPFFYPLDGLANWNRLYGAKGFVQYQFVVPKEAGRDSMTRILKKIAHSGKGSFLAVLKAFGPENENYLSFPMEGYTLALDFKIQPGLFELLDELDRMVLDAGGRIYLAKDARMQPEVFSSSYPRLDNFREVIEYYDPDRHLSSRQSARLKI